MLDSQKQRSGKRKRLGAPPAASLLPAGEPEQALHALEAYANQAEEALSEALDEVALKDRRIAALEAELRAQQRPAPAPARPAGRPAVVLPTLSPALSRPAQQTRQALEAIGRHTDEAEQALAALLAAAEEQEQGVEELQVQLQETRSELQRQQQLAANAAQEMALGKDRQIATLTNQQRRLEEALAESRRQLAGREGRIEALEQELNQLRSNSSAQAQQLDQLHNVLEHYVLRCRDLEHRAPREASATGQSTVASLSDLTSLQDHANLSPLAQRLKTQLQRQANGHTDTPEPDTSQARSASAVPLPAPSASAVPLPPPSLT